MLEQSRELSAVVEAEDSLSEVETLNTESSTSNTECKRLESELTTSELQVHRVQPSVCAGLPWGPCFGVCVCGCARGGRLKQSKLQVARLDAALEAKAQVIDALTTDCAALRDEVGTLKQDLGARAAQCEELTECVGERDGLKCELDSVTAELEKSVGEIRVLKEALTAMTADRDKLQDLHMCADLCMDMCMCMCIGMCLQELAHARAVQEVERKTADHAEIERLRAELARHAETGSCVHV